MTPTPPDPSQFTIISDYDATSQFYFCSTCGLPHRNGSGEPVFRGNLIEYEGHYDFCVDCAITVAKLLGWVEPTDGDEARAKYAAQDEKARRLESENTSLRTLVDHLKTFNEYKEAEAVRKLEQELADFKDQVRRAQEPVK